MTVLFGDEAGVSAPDFMKLALYHPQVALAVLCGIPFRPTTRTLRLDFAANTFNTPATGAFDTPIGQYAIYTDIDYTVDPTPLAAFAGSPLKTMSDFAQSQVSGVTVALNIVQSETDYAPVATQTPIQSVSRALRSARWIWAMRMPESMKARGIVQTPLQGGAGGFTVWLIFCFMQLEAARGSAYLALKPEEARGRLIEMRRYWDLKAEAAAAAASSPAAA